MSILYLDVETTTHNKGHPFDPRNFLVSVTHATNDTVCFSYYSDADFLKQFGQASRSDELCGFNIKFDLHWLARYGRVFVKEKVWDCMLAEYIISGQKNGFISLNETLASYGLPTKPDKIKEYWDAGISTEHIPVVELKEYAEWDVECLPMIRSCQQQIMSLEQINLCYLMGEDLKALATAEQFGIKYDVKAAQALSETTAAALIAVKQKLNAYLPTECVEHFNWNSGDHLSAFLYGGKVDYEYPVPEITTYKSGPHKGKTYTKNHWIRFTVEHARLFPIPERGALAKNEKETDPAYHRYQTDAPTLSMLRPIRKVDGEILSLLKEYSAIEKVSSMAESFTKTIDAKNWTDDLIHPQFNQNVTITGRLSSSAPNLQNTPPELDQLLVSRYV